MVVLGCFGEFFTIFLPRVVEDFELRCQSLLFYSFLHSFTNITPLDGENGITEVLRIVLD